MNGGCEFTRRNVFTVELGPPGGSRRLGEAVSHRNVFLRRRIFNSYALNISSECDVNFVHCRIVYSLESHLVYKMGQ